MNKTLYQTIEEKALIKGLSMRQLAIQSNVAPSSIQRWKYTKPFPSTLKKVADTLEIDILLLHNLPINNNDK